MTVNLPQSFTTANIYDPTLSSNPQSTQSNVTSVNVSIADHPIILELTGGPAPPVVNTNWNPADKSANANLSNGNETMALSSSAQGGARSTTSQSAGGYCYGVVANTISTNLSVGIANSTFNLTGGTQLGYEANGVGFLPNATPLNQTIYYNATQELYPGTGVDANGDEMISASISPTS